MSREQFQREQLYQTTMSVVRNMLKMHLITAEEYHEIDTIFAQKYQPIFGTLYADLDLL